MPKGILVFIETRDGAPLRPSLEALGAGRSVASGLGEPLGAVLLGPGSGDAATEVARFGPDRILTSEDPHLERFSSAAFAKAIAKAATDGDARGVFLASNVHGRDLAARVSARLEAGQLSDCIELAVEEGAVIAVRPVYAGKARVRVRPTSDRFVVTPRVNMFAPPEANGSCDSIDTFDPDVEESDVKAPVLSFEERRSDRPELTEAEIIVSGGRGMKGPENFHLIEGLAEAFGAAVGASRAVVDAGWRPHSEQVGQTGKTVSPNLYVACGISGAIQHLAGMSSSKYIVAINKDAEAPIFKVADYGVVGDVFEVIPALTEEVKKHRGAASS